MGSIKISNAYAIALLSLLVTACGSSQEADTAAPAPLSGEPSTIQSDLSGSSHSLVLMASLAYLDQAARTLFNGGETFNVCRKVVQKDALPSQDQPAAVFQMRINSACGSQNQYRASVRGTETFRAENALRASSPRPPSRSVVLKFSRATVETPNQLQIWMGNELRFAVGHQILFTSQDPSAGIYQFEIRSNWQTFNRDTSFKNLVADWVVTIQGRIRNEGRASHGAELYDLVTNVQASLAYEVPGAGNPVTENARLAVGSSSPVVALTQCGYPVGLWQGVYTTDLFPATQQDLDLTITPHQISGRKPKWDVRLEDCLGAPFAWADNAARAYHWQRRFRGL